MVNPRWSTLQPVRSLFGKYQVMLDKDQAACSSHDVSNGTEAQYKACNADTEHKCYVVNTAYSAKPVFGCFSSVDPIVELKAHCPKSRHAEYFPCVALPEDACSKSSKCTWRPDMYELYGYSVEADRNNTFGQAWIYGFCVPKSAPIPSDIGTNQTSLDAFNSWFAENIVLSKPNPDYEAAIGTCTFGKILRKRLDHRNGCRAINRDKDVSVDLFPDAATYLQDSNGIPQVSDYSTLNTTKVIECLESGCHVWTLKLEAAKQFGMNYSIAFCDYEPGTWAAYQFTSPYEKNLIHATELCYRNELMWNETKCLAAKL